LEALQELSSATKKKKSPPKKDQQVSAKELGDWEALQELSLHSVVKTSMEDSSFIEEFTRQKTAPLPVTALARHVTRDKATLQKGLRKWFPLHTMEMNIPVHREVGEMVNPHYHSIEGQSLFFVHWEAHFPGIKLACPCTSGCQGYLKADRTNFSKNKKLFPLFRLSGPPTWCIVMSYVCTDCKTRIDGNDGRLLVSLPEYIRNAYPVEPKFASSTSSLHLDRDLTHWMEELMLTYGNGDLLSRIIFLNWNKDYVRHLAEYLSYWKEPATLSGGR
jgi:hypothetical protein